MGLIFKIFMRDSKLSTVYIIETYFDSTGRPPRNYCPILSLKVLESVFFSD